MPSNRLLTTRDSEMRNNENEAILAILKIFKNNYLWAVEALRLPFLLSLYYEVRIGAAIEVVQDRYASSSYREEAPRIMQALNTLRRYLINDPDIQSRYPTKRSQEYYKLVKTHLLRNFPDLNSLDRLRMLVLFHYFSHPDRIRNLKELPFETIEVSYENLNLYLKNDNVVSFILQKWNLIGNSAVECLRDEGFTLEQLEPFSTEYPFLKSVIDGNRECRVDANPLKLTVGEPSKASLENEAHLAKQTGLDANKQGVDFYKKNQFPEAINSYVRALIFLGGAFLEAKDPNNLLPRTHHNLACAYEKNLQPLLAIVHFYLSGNFYTQRNNSEEANKEFSRLFQVTGSSKEHSREEAKTIAPINQFHQSLQEIQRGKSMVDLASTMDPGLEFSFYCFCDAILNAPKESFDYSKTLGMNKK
jgi:hypothetical protein